MDNEELNKMVENYVIQSKKIQAKAIELIEKYIDLAEVYCKNYCITDGLLSILAKKYYAKEEVISDVNPGVVYDIQNFAFTKSIKTLKAIRRLVNDEDNSFGEDILCLSRTILENYVISRYAFENITGDDSKRDGEVIRKVLQGPLAGVHNLATEMGFDDKEILPKDIKTWDTGCYFDKLYKFMSNYVHFNFGLVDNYLFDGEYSSDLDCDYLFAIIIALFCFERQFENVVNVEGEDFESKTEAKRYCNISYDTLEFLDMAFDFFIYYYERFPFRMQDIYFIQYYANIDMLEKVDIGEQRVAMIKAMKNALFNDTKISDLKKEKKSNGKYIRKYIL